MYTRFFLNMQMYAMMQDNLGSELRPTGNTPMTPIIQI